VNPTQLQYAEFAEHRVPREAAGATRWHLLAPYQEVTDAVIDVLIDRPVGIQARTVAEVRAPAAQ
jgi:hypothetical protein